MSEILDSGRKIVAVKLNPEDLERSLDSPALSQLYAQGWTCVDTILAEEGGKILVVMLLAAPGPQLRETRMMREEFVELSKDLRSWRMDLWNGSRAERVQRLVFGGVLVLLTVVEVLDLLWRVQGAGTP